MCPQRLIQCWRMGGELRAGVLARSAEEIGVVDVEQHVRFREIAAAGLVQQDNPDTAVSEVC